MADPFPIAPPSPPAPNEGLLREITESHEQSRRRRAKVDAAGELHGFLAEKQCVGDIISMDYDTAEVLIHDRLRRDVGGVPHGCLLLATRLKPDPEPESLAATDLDDPQASLILLRALRSSPLPNDIEMKEARLRAGQRAAQTEHNWDEGGKTDLFTLDQMRYAGAHCRILGTFRMVGEEGSWSLRFGGDIDNFYAGQGLKVYKPIGGALGRIINYRTAQESAPSPVRIGVPRYAASARPAEVDYPPYELSTRDLVAQRTALFGMTRTGKSNTTKTIAAAIHRLRQDKDAPLRVGQLILDPNGEYANDNPQDQGCLRRVSEDPGSDSGDVVTFGMAPHPNDPNRRLTKFNFFGNDLPGGILNIGQFNDSLQSLYRGKLTLNGALRTEGAGYIRQFINTDLSPPGAVGDRGEQTRYLRLIFFYRAILSFAGFQPPRWSPNVNFLFNEKLRRIMAEDESVEHYVPYLTGERQMSWSLAADFSRDFSTWTTGNMFKKFDGDYANTHKEGRNWSDERLLGLLAIFRNTRGRALMSDVRRWHDPAEVSDYISDLVNHVRSGALVILDQALGDPEMNRLAGEQIAERLFASQQQSFVDPKADRRTGEVRPPPPVILYAEEAHTLLPKGTESDTRNIWSRIAKEGAKFNIGLVYSTQEPSSIQTNILKNTENWLIAHLNNSDELREVAKYNDFADFKDSILKVREVGLLRVRTLSSPFTVPVQIDEFRV